MGHTVMSQDAAIACGLKISAMEKVETELGEDSRTSPIGFSNAKISIHGYLPKYPCMGIC